MHSRSSQAQPRPFSKLPAPDRTGWPWDSEPAEAGVGLTAPPKISIVIPSYQQGEYLEETLRSILLQGYPDLELLVYDGGSTDETVEILERYAPWIDHWVSEPDGGQSDAINRGFERASGDIVTFFGSDDVYEPGTFADVARRFLDDPSVGAIVGAFRFLDEDSRRLEPVHPPRLPDGGPHDLALLDPGQWRLHQVSTFYTRHALDAVGRHVREDLHYTMDRELLQRVVREFPIALSPRCYAGFRLHPSSKSVSAILPMSREMAALHRLDAPEDEPARTRRRRRSLARFRLARGHLKLARSGAGRWRRLASWVALLAYRPTWIAKRGYWNAGLEALGLLRSGSGL